MVHDPPGRTSIGWHGTRHQSRPRGGHASRSSRQDQLSPNVTRLVVEAPRIAEIRQPGQFVIVRLGPGAERIPLTIADADPEAGTISLIIQAIGKSTDGPGRAGARRRHHRHRRPARPPDRPDRARPRGVRRRRRRHGGHPADRPGLARRGVPVTSVIGGRSREWVILEDELRTAGEVIVCTDDGSYGRHGFVTEALKDLLARRAGSTRSTPSARSR